MLKQSKWLVFAVRVTFNEHNLSILGVFVEHNRKIFGAVQHSIIGYFLSIIGSALHVSTGRLSRLKPWALYGLTLPVCLYSVSGIDTC